MGDKIEAKRTAARLGIPCVPGSDGAVERRRRRRLKIAAEIGYPVLVKAAAGGGGRGMKVAQIADDLARRASRRAKIEAKAAFGDDAVYLEKYLAKPRHIEIQVLGDGKGRAIHLGERDCSLQRRHQKVWEEGPSPALNAGAARGDRRHRRHGDGRARLHRRRHDRVPLRERQILFHRDEHPHPGRASGDRDDHRHRPRQRADQDRRRLAADHSRRRTCASQGAAIECRVNAEHPRTFMPSPGRITYFHPPGRPRRARRFGGLPGLRHPALLRLARSAS